MFKRVLPGGMLLNKFEQDHRLRDTDCRVHVQEQAAARDTNATQ